MHHSRIDALDGVRGYAILAVVFLHAGWTPAGSNGVKLFFTLSGFLITFLLLNEQDATGRISIKDFYLRRIVRLVPALYVMFAIIALWSVTIAPEPFGIASLWGILYGLFYFSNWAASFPEYFTYGWLGTLGHTWTLAVEAQFYLIWPLLFLVMRKFPPLFSGVFFFLLFSAAEFYRIEMYKSGVSLPYLCNATDMNMSALIIGVSLAFMVKACRGWFPPSIVSVLFLAFFVITTFRIFPWVVDPSTLAIGILEFGAAISIWALLNPGAVAKIFFCNPVITFIGRISYSLYLWHFPVFIALEQGHYMDGIALEVTKGALSFVAAILSYYYVERPALSWWRQRSASEGQARRPAAALVQQR